MKNSNRSVVTSATARDERGQGLVEYALIIALVSLAAVLALGFLSGKINTLFSKTGNVLNNVAASSGSAGGGPSAPAAPNVTSGPAEGSSGNTAAFTSPSFSFTGDGTQTGFQCSLDLAAFSGCTSPQAYSGLGAGSHSFRVQASNGGGTSTPATRNWAVTVSAPSGGSVQICAFSSQSNANSNTSPDCSPPYSANSWLRANTCGMVEHVRGRYLQLHVDALQQLGLQRQPFIRGHRLEHAPDRLPCDGGRRRQHQRERGLLPRLGGRDKRRRAVGGGDRLRRGGGLGLAGFGNWERGAPASIEDAGAYPRNDAN